MPKKSVKTKKIVHHKNKRKHVTFKSILVISLLIIFGFAIAGYLVFVMFFKGISMPKSVETQMTENNAESKYSFNVAYPQIIDLGDAQKQQQINQQITFLVKNTVDTFVKDAKENRSPFVPSDIFSTLNVTYNVENLDKKVISILFVIEDFQAGAAHPDTYALPFNYDVQAGKQLVLADLFVPGSDYINVLSKYAQSDLKTQDKKAGNNYEEFIAEGAAPKAENFQKFALTKNSLILLFDPAVVSPYVAGIRQVVIPFSGLSLLLQSASK